IWSVNIRGMQTATNLIKAMTPSSAGVGTNISAFEDLAAHPSFAAQEVREQIVSFSASVVQSPQVANDEKQRIATLAITEMEKQVNSYPLDARERLQLAYAYRVVGNNADALKQIQAAILLSPNKEGFWIEAGAAEWELGNNKEAQASFNKAYELGSQFPILATYAAVGNILVGDISSADKILTDTYGTTIVDSDILAIAYYHTKNWPRLIAIWKSRAEKPGASIESWFSLASAYYISGDSANAIKTINKAVALYPEAASSGASAIKQIQEKAAGQ
ncbi:MAG: tetratricopeptide repeat protein, partial [bacterium]